MGCGASKQEMDKELINIVKTTFTPTGDAKKDELRARGYAKAIGMDKANTEMAVVMATEGLDAAATAMIKKHTTNGNFDYFAMRQQYG
jgi:pyocin large subunit-like protein